MSGKFTRAHPGPLRLVTVTNFRATNEEKNQPLEHLQPRPSLVQQKAITRAISNLQSDNKQKRKTVNAPLHFHLETSSFFFFYVVVALIVFIAKIMP